MAKEDVVCVHTHRHTHTHTHIHTHTHTIYTIKYYSAIENNEIMLSAATWMDLEIIIQSEVGQRQIPYYITYMWNLKRWYK